MSTLRAAAIWIVATAAAGLALSSAVLALGWLLAHTSGLSLFQGSMVLVATLAAAAVCTSLARIAHSLIEIQSDLHDWLHTDPTEAAAEGAEPAAQPAVAATEATEAPNDPPRSRRQVH